MNQFYNNNNPLWLQDGSIRSKMINYTPMDIVKSIQEKRINIKPSFKSHHDWPISWASRIIESLILGFPIQNIICEENEFGELTVLDGTKILNSLFRFFNGEFRLKDLTLRKDLNGCMLNELSYREYSFLMERYIFTFVIINYDSPNMLKYEFYKRINATTTRFTVQSARNYAFPKMFEMIKNIESMTGNSIKYNIFKSNASRDVFKSRTDIDQFILFLCMFVLDANNHIPNGEYAITEKLDMAAEAMNDPYRTSGLDNYVANLLREFIWNDMRGNYISIEAVRESDIEQSSDMIYLSSDEYMSMERFLYKFNSFVLRGNGHSINDRFPMYESDVPNYWDTKRIYKQQY
ncbi:hypothetical protein C7387_3166 [Yokenella regensburgei]|uniref:DUF3800 domain-containing protein n=1 Tax=Yokenella regensburgei TaxID=158877 RepID=A0ABX9RYH2_9ENTR|nr:DUF262 domain-containing protein [Yokenella regensburgei]RKR53697.1 hypothetical protein C7387_3166 [Yokenella regensburgei]VFS15079.1 Uncharacterised protein [Yokenella regensburgei]